MGRIQSTGQPPVLETRDGPVPRCGTGDGAGPQRVNPRAWGSLELGCRR